MDKVEEFRSQNSESRSSESETRASRLKPHAPLANNKVVVLLTGAQLREVVEREIAQAVAVQDQITETICTRLVAERIRSSETMRAALKDVLADDGVIISDQEIRWKSSRS